nr:family 20 glycosylhydrolase [Candidatus Sigynarchaeota archaeon]
MEPQFLPRPKNIVLSLGENIFEINKGTFILTNNNQIHEFLVNFTQFIFPFPFPIKIGTNNRSYPGPCCFLFVSNHPGPENGIEAVMPSFALVEDSIKVPGSYNLKITPDGILMLSMTAGGLFNACWTLSQLISQTNQEKLGSGITRIPCMDVSDFPDVEFRAVQIHLKTHLHRFAYLEERIRLMASLKINAVLWEWEDKLPFSASLDIRHPLAFTGPETARLVSLCEKLGMETIPLVQTFGHLEFVLKLPKYKHLRENLAAHEQERTLDICPLHPETMPLLERMIDDMARFHPNSRYIHIGGDEVYTIGTCPACKEFVNKHGAGDVDKGKGILYVTHVNKIINIVKARGKIPMIWHDYLLKYPAHIDALDKDVIIVYWRYGKDLEHENYTEEIEIFKHKGFKVLAANSLRSTFQAGIPNYSERFQNIHDLNKALVHEPRNVAGILATDWAMCMVPMESAIPGLLFFVENAWNVNHGDLTRESLRRVARQSLVTFFKVAPAQAAEHEDLFYLLHEGVIRLRSDLELRNDPRPFMAALEQVERSWIALGHMATAGKNVIDNILHGLRLQLLKVRLVALVKDFNESFDAWSETEDDPFTHITNEHVRLEGSINDLKKEFEAFKMDTLVLFGRVAYASDVNIELTRCYDKVISFLEKVDDQIVTLVKMIEAFPRAGKDELQSFLDEFTCWFFAGAEKLYDRFL